MSTIALLITKNKYPYHINISNIIQTALDSSHHSLTILDVDSYTHECLTELNTLQPDVLITLDLAGFHFRTQTGENALNMFCTKNLNLIWGSKPEYAPYLNKKISMSMLFYDATGKDNHLPTLYPNMLYYKALSKLTDADAFKAIWNDFTTEVLLLQT